MDSVRSGPFGQIFRPDNFIFGQVSSFCLSQRVWQLELHTLQYLQTTALKDCIDVS